MESAQLEEDEVRLARRDHQQNQGHKSPDRSGLESVGDVTSVRRSLYSLHGGRAHCDKSQGGLYVESCESF